MSLQVPGPALLSSDTVAAPAGTTPVGTSGITATQVAYGSGVNTIKGSSQLLFIEGGSLQIDSTALNGVQVYNTTDHTTNYERIVDTWAASVAYLGQESGGTGQSRALRVGIAPNGTALNNANARRIDFATSAPFITFNQGQSSAAAAAMLAANTNNTATAGNVSGFLLTSTYNQAASAAANTDLTINRIKTSVGSGAQLFLDGQISGVSQFSVSDQGGISVKSNANGRAGTFVLVAGTVTVANTSVTANSVIEFTVKTVGGTIGIAPQVVSTVVGTSFTVTGAGTNTSTYNYIIKEIIP